MLTSERRKMILQIVNAQGSAKVGDIARAVGVTNETIRKDLHFLSEQSLIKKEFGGAVALRQQELTHINTRTSEAIDEKTRIALKAAEYIKEHSIVFLDSGSTALYLARFLPTNANLTLVTNSFLVVEPCLKAAQNVHFVGGEISGITMSSCGLWADQAIDTLQFDVSFLGSSGFFQRSGPCSAQFLDAQLKRRVLKKSRYRVVLADSSKFHSNSLIQYAEWADIDLLITSVDAPEDILDEIRKSVEVITA